MSDDLTLTVTPQTLAFTVTPQTLAFTAAAQTNHLDVAFTGPAGIRGIDGVQGPQGIPGIAGGSLIQCVAGESISGHRAIRLNNGFAFYCNSMALDNAGTAIGISTQATLTGGTFNVQTLGIIDEGSWNWIPGPVFVGNNGLLTQIPTGVFTQQIGVATTATEININPQLAILRV